MMADTKTPRFTIKGWHVLVAMIVFFGTVIAVNTVFITVALQSFPGEETRRSYVQGLDYNEVIEARRAQSELGWTAGANLADGRALIEVLNSKGEPVTGLRLEGTLQHPADMSQDRELVFTEVREGVYAASIADLDEGQWTLAAAADGDTPFSVEARLWHR